MLPNDPTSTATIASSQLPNNVNVITLKATPGNLFGLECYNVGGTLGWAKLYNGSGLAAGSGSGIAPQRRVAIPANGQTIIPIPEGEAYTTAISLQVTTGFADNDGTAPPANAIVVNARFK